MLMTCDVGRGHSTSGDVEDFRASWTPAHRICLVSMSHLINKGWCGPGNHGTALEPDSQGHASAPGLQPLVSP